MGSVCSAPENRHQALMKGTHPMKRSKYSLLGAALAAGVLAATLASPAAADPTPQPKDVVGVGSDTSQFALDFLADGVVVGGSLTNGYNSNASGARLVSFDALVPGNTNQIVLKAGTAPINRPNGSGSGKALLYGAGNNANVNFARSSSGPSSAENAAGLWHVPFAVDGLRLAVASSSNAPASITGAQLVDIYKGNITNWNQIGGQSGVIVPMVPQSGSGTRSFFEAQLKALNGNVAVTYGPSVVDTVQEHDASPIAANPNAVAPFSTGRFGSATGIKLVQGSGSFAAQRALYNVVRGADLTSGWFSSMFSTSGFACSGAAYGLIEAAGFTQLATSDDGGVCGVPTQSATTNFTTL